MHRKRTSTAILSALCDIKMYEFDGKRKCYSNSQSLVYCSQQLPFENVSSLFNLRNYQIEFQSTIKNFSK